MLSDPTTGHSLATGNRPATSWGVVTQELTRCRIDPVVSLQLLVAICWENSTDELTNYRIPPYNMLAKFFLIRLP